MLVPVTAAYRPRRKPARPSGLTPPPVSGLSLVAASFDSAALSLTLTFDRPVSIVGFNPAQVLVGDGLITGTIYSGSAAVLVEPAVMRIALNSAGAYSTPQTVLNASNHTGIVAVNDGGTWRGASNVNLPLV